MSRRRNSNARVDEQSTNISRYICQEDNTIKKSIKCPTETRKDTKVNNLSATKHEKDILGLLNESKQMKSSIKIDSKNKETLNDAEADAEFNKIMSGLQLGNKWKQGNS